MEQKGTAIPIGTVVKYQLSLERKGGKAVYNALPFTDKLSGAQVLLVPVKGENATNPDLQGLKNTITTSKITTCWINQALIAMCILVPLKP